MKIASVMAWAAIALVWALAGWHAVDAYRYPQQLDAEQRARCEWKGGVIISDENGHVLRCVLVLK